MGVQVGQLTVALTCVHVAVQVVEVLVEVAMVTV